MHIGGRRSLWLRLGAIVVMLALVALFVVVGLERVEPLAAVLGVLVAVASLFVSMSVRNPPTVPSEQTLHQPGQQPTQHTTNPAAPSAPTPTTPTAQSPLANPAATSAGGAPSWPGAAEASAGGAAAWRGAAGASAGAAGASAGAAGASAGAPGQAGWPPSQGGGQMPAPGTVFELTPGPVEPAIRPRSHRRHGTLRPVLVSLGVIAILLSTTVALWTSGKLPGQAGPPGAMSSPSPMVSSSAAPTMSVSPQASPTPMTATASPNPPKSSGPTTAETNAALFAQYGITSFTQNWLPRLNRCASQGPQTQYERDYGLIVVIACNIIGEDATISFRKYGALAKAVETMVCQEVPGAPAGMNETEVDLPGSSGSRAGMYCEYNARYEDPPTTDRMEIGVDWTDATLPVRGEIFIGQHTVAQGPSVLAKLRQLWNNYA